MRKLWDDESEIRGVVGISELGLTLENWKAENRIGITPGKGPWHKEGEKEDGKKEK